MSYLIGKFESILGIGITMINSTFIEPTWGFEETEILNVAEHITQGGDFVTYKWASYESLTIPIEYLPTSDAQLINQWWQNGDTVVVSGVDTGIIVNADSSWVGRIVNRIQPFAGIREPYTDQFNGNILLEVFDV